MMIICKLFLSVVVNALCGCICEGGRGGGGCLYVGKKSSIVVFGNNAYIR